MKILRFQATKVYGSYNFDFSFNPDITFLVGINGSGKTTALRLMQAALSFDLNTLCAISFNTITLEVDDINQHYTLSVIGTKEKLTFTLNNQEFSVNIPPLVERESKNLSATSRLDDFLDSQRLKIINDGGDLLRRFITSFRPLFLGLERRMGRYDDEPYYFSENIQRDISYRSMRHRRDSLEGLENCQRIIEMAYRRFRRVSDKNSEKLLNIIVESTFEYIDFDHESLREPFNPHDELRKFQQRREEIEKFASGLVGSTKVSNQISTFFSKVEEILSRQNSNDSNDGNDGNDNLSIEWLLNISQIQRIRKVLEEIDRQKKISEKIYSPIKEFKETMNEFLRQSRKNLEIDSLGRIKITQNGSLIDDLGMLSSGEKQLLILVTHAKFGSRKEGVFIVDEPELSLHMRWQEMLVDALLEGDGYSQFIFATHSPEIVGFRKDQCIKVN